MFDLVGRTDDPSGPQMDHLVDTGPGSSEDQPGGLRGPRIPSPWARSCRAWARSQQVMWWFYLTAREAVPVQVDERVVQVLRSTARAPDDGGPSRPARPTRLTALSTPMPTFTARTYLARPDDEVVGPDAGDRGHLERADGVVPGSGLELSLIDGEDEAWIYLRPTSDCSNPLPGGTTCSTPS